jgi:hypothetical protein
LFRLGEHLALARGSVALPWRSYATRDGEAPCAPTVLLEDSFVNQKAGGAVMGSVTEANHPVGLPGSVISMVQALRRRGRQRRGDGVGAKLQTPA